MVAGSVRQLGWSMPFRACLSVTLGLCVAILGAIRPQLALAQPTAAPLDQDTREEVIRVAAKATDAFGREAAGDLVVTLFRPAGAGPFPLVVINHGRSSSKRAEYGRQRYESAARYFVRKGFVVAVPLRLGYGELADKGDPEEHVSCTAPRYAPALRAAAEQVRTVVEALRQRPDVDAGRLVLLGQSVGGVTTVAASAMGIPGLVASINVAGGHGGNPETHPGEACSAYVLERLMGEYGARATAPMLWVYTENDRYFAPGNSQAWHQAFVRAGGKADYRLLPPHGEDGHNLFVRGNDVWQPLVDAYLAPLGFSRPGAVARPPLDGPADDPALTQSWSEAARTGYARFLQGQAPRAFARGPRGQWGWATGDDALSRALANCQRRSTEACTLLSVDAGRVAAALPAAGDAGARP